MSEKRFRAMSNEAKQLYCIENAEGEMFSIQEVVDLLNSQEEKIKDLNAEIRSLRKWGKFLEKENEELKQRIALFEQQEDEFEQYTAQTIENMIADYRDDE